MRERLPQRRPLDVIVLEGAFAQALRHPVRIGIGRAHPAYPVREVFIDAGQAGDTLAALARDAAILISLCLQHGVSARSLAGALTRGADGEPMTIAGAAMDLIEREG